ncbi:hypothetical protein BASA62_002743 [Batrachochytrium salamandrivorans]|nr:hypothetical protein BASA62_002743 [Batrachochytrium salamandrivorans]
MMWVKCGHLCFGKSTGILLPSTDFRSNLYDASQSAGNIVAMKIIMGGLMLQSCNPTFRAARDAIVAADHSTTRCQQVRDPQGICQAWSRSQRPPSSPHRMTFRFHLNVSSDSAPVSYDVSLQHIKQSL